MPARWLRPRPTTPCSSPTLGDHLAFYGDRSILNYRRIPTSGSRPARLSPGGSGAVSGADRRPSPGRRHAGLLRGRHRFPFWDSLALLQRHFTLTRACATSCRSSRSPRRPRPCRRHACPVPTPAPTRVSAQWFG
ncbi:MAG: hypothetical protein R2851_18720 [Caldilineaceae bacterium]